MEYLDIKKLLIELPKTLKVEGVRYSSTLISLIVFALTVLKILTATNDVFYILELYILLFCTIVIIVNIVIGSIEYIFLLKTKSEEFKYGITYNSDLYKSTPKAQAQIGEVDKPK